VGRPAAPDAGEAAAGDPGEARAQDRRDQEDPVDVRIICATHQNLASLSRPAASGRISSTGFNVIELTMPPLRECREDIPVIAASILGRLGAQAGSAPAQLTAEAVEELGRYDFPGNIRELEKILERAVALSATASMSPICASRAPHGRGGRCSGNADAAPITWMGSSARRSWMRSPRPISTVPTAAKLLGINVPPAALPPASGSGSARRMKTSLEGLR